MNLYPSESDFIDIHSHSGLDDEGVFRIHNVFLSNYQKNSLDRPFSLGLHPWHIGENTISDIGEVLSQSTSNPNLFTFGETGLDSLIKTPMSKQIEIFRTHIECGIQHNKPLVIHCVKAFPELLALKKEYKNSSAWIIHGFNANQTIASECVKMGIYISISQRLLRNPEKAQKIASVVPLSMIFAETDEDGMSIQEVYGAISGLYGEDVSEIKRRIFKNFEAVDGIKG